MSMTEEAANSKCCLVLELIQAVQGAGSPTGLTGPVGCIGGSCAHWEWAEDEFAERFVSASGGGGQDSVQTTRTIKPEERQGDCGLKRTSP